jgi:magnesium transporter
MQGDIDKLSEAVFAADSVRPRDGARDATLKTVGKQGDLTTRARESLLSLSRLLGYFSALCDQRGGDKPVKARLETATRDVNSLSDHLTYLNGQITFLLDATLGFISIDQNRIIKIISVVSLVFTPPTLIASIYGMNFHWIPELAWDWGYPLALLGMVLTAVLPLWYFRSKGWL